MKNIAVFVILCHNFTYIRCRNEKYTRDKKIPAKMCILFGKNIVQVKIAVLQNHSEVERVQ